MINCWRRFGVFVLAWRRVARNNRLLRLQVPPVDGIEKFVVKKLHHFELHVILVLRMRLQMDARDDTVWRAPMPGNGDGR